MQIFELRSQPTKHPNNGLCSWSLSATTVGWGLELSFDHGQLQNFRNWRTFCCSIQWYCRNVGYSARQCLRISKKLMNFFCSNFWAMPWSTNSRLTNQKTDPRNRQKEVHVVCLLVFALSSHAGSLLPLFTCVWWPGTPWAPCAYDATTSSSTYP